MSGICGIVGDVAPEKLTRTLDAMMDAMRDEGQYVEHRFVDREAGVGLGCFNLKPVAERVAKGLINQTAAFHGEVYEIHRKEAGESEPDDVGFLLQRIRRADASFLSGVHGSFSAAVWDSSESRLVLVNDRFGMRPLYWVKLPGRILFATRLAAIMRDPEVPRDLSPEGVSQFFSFGQYLNDETSFRSIRVLPAASLTTYSVKSDRLEQASYWESSQDETPIPTDERELLEQIDVLFKQAVDRRTLNTERLGIAISGGLDARAILGVIDHDRCSPTAICYTMPGSLDHRTSQRMAEHVGCTYHHNVLDENFLRDFFTHLDRMVQLTDGQYLSQCIALPTLPKLHGIGIDYLLRGHAGELMHMQKAYAYSVDSSAFSIQDSAGLEKWCFERLQGFMLAEVDEPLFRFADEAEVEEMSRNSLRQCLRRIEAVESPLQRIWHLFVQQRLRRETTLSLAKFGSVAEPRIPYLDNDLVPVLLKAPPRLKVSESIQAHILGKRRPEFLRIPNANTGTRVGAGPLARRISTFRLRVLAKLGVPGYQPYERLGLWLRRELADQVKHLLTSDACLDRGILAPDGVRRVVADHLSGQRNHTFLIMAMMIFELGQRRLVDQDATDSTAGAVSASSGADVV